MKTLREMMDIVEGKINEFAPSGGDEGSSQEKPSQVALAIERLVSKGARVQVQLSGVRGRVAWVDVKPDGSTEIKVQFRNLDKKPTHGNTLSLELDSNDDNTLKLDMSSPDQYVLTGEYKRKNPMRHLGIDETVEDPIQKIEELFRDKH